MDFALAVPDFLGPAAATRLVVPRESATLTGRPLRAACACLADFLALISVLGDLGTGLMTGFGVSDFGDTASGLEAAIAKPQNSIVVKLWPKCFRILASFHD